MISRSRPPRHTARACAQPRRVRAAFVLPALRLLLAVVQRNRDDWNLVT